jgi:hypothetical protein
MTASEGLVAIVGMLICFGLPIVLVVTILEYKRRKLRLVHETIARLAEKGLPVPPELMERPRPGQYGLRGGLVLVALGIALAVFFTQAGGPWSIGLIPGLMGLALLLSWAIERRWAR